MTREKLIKGKELESLINYHISEKQALNKNVVNLQNWINGKHIREVKSMDFKVQAGAMKPDGILSEDRDYLVWENVKIERSGYTGMSANIRPKALISYLQTEAQYHDQEAKKYERELKRL